LFSRQLRNYATLEPVRDKSPGEGFAVANFSPSFCCKTATFSLFSAERDSPDPPQVGQGSTWVPVVVMVIVLPPPHRQHLAIDRPSTKNQVQCPTRHDRLGSGWSNQLDGDPRGRGGQVRNPAIRPARNDYSTWDTRRRQKERLSCGHKECVGADRPTQEAESKRRRKVGRKKCRMPSKIRHRK
jgi:hypothetical protein